MIYEHTKVPLINTYGLPDISDPFNNILFVLTPRYPPERIELEANIGKSNLDIAVTPENCSKISSEDIPPSIFITAENITILPIL